MNEKELLHSTFQPMVMEKCISKSSSAALVQLESIFPTKNGQQVKMNAVCFNFTCTCDGRTHTPIDKTPKTQIIYLIITWRWSWFVLLRTPDDYICDESNTIVCSTSDLPHKIHFPIWRTWTKNWRKQNDGKNYVQQSLMQNEKHVRIAFMLYVSHSSGVEQ